VLDIPSSQVHFGYINIHIFVSHQEALITGHCQEEALDNVISLTAEAAVSKINISFQFASAINHKSANLGAVSVLFERVSLQARVAKSQSVNAVSNCALVQVIHTIVVWSQVFVQDVFQITVKLASVTYLLLEESAISAVVASAQAVTSQSES